jgi:hypothetical protein
MKNKNNRLNAVGMVRKIRDKNYQVTKNMTAAEKLDFIHKRAAMVNDNLTVLAKD